MNPLYLVACLTTLAGLASAQTTTNSSSSATVLPPSPSQGQHYHRLSPERELSWLTTELGLSEEQRRKIKPVLVAKAEKLKAVREDSTLSNDQMHQQIKVLLKSTDQKIELFLLPEQMRAFAQLHHNKWAQKEGETESDK